MNHRTILKQTKFKNGRRPDPSDARRLGFPVLRDKPSFVYECETEEEEDEEDEQVTEARLEASYARTREALELLTLVAHVDKAA
ncbi:hypothetical protein BBJ28_00020676 [Nothophytophthora sp. Chile5]|nr:hypothetical protein BBJ28_00020676 [Nothophytophthora sp. Chile5]